VIKTKRQDDSASSANSPQASLKAMTTLLIASLFYASLTGCAEGPQQSFPVAAQGVLSGEISTDGRHAVIGSIHHGGSYWDIAQQERLFNWNHKAGEMSTLRAAALSKDGSRAVSCEEDNIVMWDTGSGKPLQFWQAEDRIHTISLNNRGDRALMGLRDGSVNFFDLDRGVTLHQFKHQAEVRATGITPDGRVGISAGDDNTVKIYDLSTGKEMQQRVLSNQIKTLAISDSGRLAFASAQRESSIIWNIETETPVVSKENRVTNFSTADFSPDESFLTLGTFSGKIIRLNTQTGEQINEWQAKPRKYYGSATSKAILSLTDDGTHVTALTSDGMLEVFQGK
jgi:WD40 repeat protein